ncbi:MAG: 2-oxoglutarate dehydrogenase E1 subunit family protein, partial [Acidimicrobiales bacterium]
MAETTPARDSVQATQAADEAFGPNAWLVDEMYERYRADPESVAESWRDFFVGYRPDGGLVPPTAQPAAPPPVAAVPARPPMDGVT